ncbi:hypothetical protein ABIF26_009572 [Bradyrhizobium elkanii]|uniref:hypothetical protein n=1 Tax=Bradyrhizobium elkanii TaxID=29448 RepID=UPI0035113CB3
MAAHDLNVACHDVLAHSLNKNAGFSAVHESNGAVIFQLPIELREGLDRRLENSFKKVRPDGPKAYELQHF